MLKILVREVAEQKGLDAAKLARKADIAHTTIYELWNNPYKIVSTATLTKLARALGCKVTDLIIDTDEEIKMQS